MKIVKHKDGKYSVRKWCLVYWFADNYHVDLVGWWRKNHPMQYKVDTLAEAEALYKKVEQHMHTGYDIGTPV